MTTEAIKVESQLIDANDVAALLGVSRGTIYKLLRENRFPQPTHRLGRRIVRWHRAVVQEFITQGVER